jgi:hypothetical protein
MLSIESDFTSVYPAVFVTFFIEIIIFLLSNIFHSDSHLDHNGFLASNFIDYDALGLVNPVYRIIASKLMHEPIVIEPEPNWNLVQVRIQNMTCPQSRLGAEVEG